MSIGKRVANGALWMLALKLAVKSIGLVSTIVLARVLAPEDFGLIAIIMAFFALIEIFGSFSFDTVLIQKQDATSSHYDTAWSFNLAFGFFACFFVMASSAWVAEFYGDSRIRDVMMVLGLLFLISGAQNIGVVQFRKNLTFDQEFKFQLIPKIVSFFVTVALAFTLKSYWALVWGSLVWRLLVVVFSYFVHPYRPRIDFSEWRQLFGFSKWLMINNVFFFLNNKSPEMVVGKIISPQAAGLFTVANEIAVMPTSEMVGNINTATYPGYCLVSGDLVELRRMYLSVMGIVAFMVLPAGLGLSSISDLLVPVVLGEKWLESIPLVAVLAISGSLIALNTNTGFLFLAMARPVITTMMSFFRVLMLLPAMIYFGSLYGLAGVASSILLTSIGVFLSFLILIRIELGVVFSQIFGVYLRPLVASLGMYASIKLLNPFLLTALGQTGALFVLCLVGVVVYCFLIFVMWLAMARPDGAELKVWNFLIAKFFDPK